MPSTPNDFERARHHQRLKEHDDAGSRIRPAPTRLCCRFSGAGPPSKFTIFEPIFAAKTPLDSACRHGEIPRNNAVDILANTCFVRANRAI